MTLIQVTEPAEEPVTRDQAKANLRRSGIHEDALFDLWIAAARRMVEAHTRRRLVTQEVELRRARLGGAITLPVAPVRSVTAVTYLDPAGVEQVLAPATYRLVRDRALARLVPATGASWPATLGEPDSVAVRLEVGFGAAADVPPELKAAVLMLVGHLDQHREGGGGMPAQVADVLDRWILWV